MARENLKAARKATGTNVKSTENMSEEAKEQVEIMQVNPVFERLKQEALYAQRSFSKELLYQTYGKAQMARELNALSYDEFMEINHLTVYFMNTDREYVRQQNKEFYEIWGEIKPKKEGNIE